MDTPTGGQRLYAAVRRGDLQAVRRLLDANERDVLGFTALHGAVISGRTAFVRLLVERGADVNATKGGRTALHAAAVYNRHGVVKLLVEKGTDVNAKSDDNGSTALHEAAAHGHLAVMKPLVELGADVNATNNLGDTALIIAARESCYERFYGSDLSKVRLLVEHGADVNAQNDRGETALHEPVARGQKEAAHFLLDHGAVAVIANNEGRTPLDNALKPWYGPRDVGLICRMLLPSGALVHLAKGVVEAHGKRLRAGLKKAVRSAGFLEGVADALAGIDASGRARGTDEMLRALLRQLDAFARAEDGAGGLAAAGARDIRRLARGRGAAYAERRRRYRLAVAAAVRSRAFLSNLEEGLAGATSARGAAAKGLDALAGDGGGTSAARAPKRRRR